MMVQQEERTVVWKDHSIPRIHHSILGKISILAESLHLSPPSLAPAVVDVLARIAIKTALDCANEAYWIAFFEFAGDVAGSCRDHMSCCLVPDRDGIFAEDEALIVGFEEHHIGMA